MYDSSMFHVHQMNYWKAEYVHVTMFTFVYLSLYMFYLYSSSVVHYGSQKIKWLSTVFGIVNKWRDGLACKVLTLRMATLKKRMKNVEAANI